MDDINKPFFFNNIANEVIEIYSDLISTKNDTKAVGLKNLLGSLSTKFKKGSPCDKKVFNQILDDINTTDKTGLIIISKRLKSLLYNPVLSDKIRKFSLPNVILAQKIIQLTDVSDVKLNSIKVILSHVVHSIITYFISESFKRELDIHKTLERFDSYNNIDSLSCYIDVFYGIEYLIITEVLTKLLTIYFTSNSRGGSKVIVSKSIVNSLKNLDTLIKRNNLNDRPNYINTFTFLKKNLLSEFEGGTKCLNNILSDLKEKDKNITKETLLKDPVLYGAINLALGEVEMPKVAYDNKKEIVTKSGSEILDTVFGSRASSNIKKIFDEKYNMNADDIVNQVNDYKEKINNNKPLRSEDSSLNFENSFNFTEKDVDILYTLNLIDALKTLGNNVTPLSKLYDVDKKMIDKNITINFYTPVVKTNIDGLPIESESKD